MKRILGILGGLSLAIILIPAIAGAAFLGVKRIQGYRPQLLPLPGALPAGFSAGGEIRSDRVPEGVVSEIVYTGTSGGSFTYKIKPKSLFIPCRKPETESSSFYGYIVFRPNDADDGCALTGKLVDGTLRIYRWRRGDKAFDLLVENSAVSDEDVFRMAASLRTELVFIEDLQYNGNLTGKQ